MELNQIRYFVVLAKELHFTRAAEQCNVSQPSLTKAIQKLEDELGGALFVRDRARTQLTELGQTMLPSLSRAMNAAVEAKMQAAAFRRRVSSPLRIGLELSISASLLTPVLGELQRHCSDIELSLFQNSHRDLSERMLQGEIDVGLLVDNGDVPERLHRWPLFSEGYVLVVPPDHPRPNAEAVMFGALANEALLLAENVECPIRRLVDATLAQNGIRPRRQIYFSSQEQILDMVGAGIGVAVLGERVPSSAHLARLPIMLNTASRSIMLATAAGRPLGPSPGLFLKMMRARSWLAPSVQTGMIAA